MTRLNYAKHQQNTHDPQEMDHGRSFRIRQNGVKQY